MPDQRKIIACPGIPSANNKRTLMPHQRKMKYRTAITDHIKSEIIIKLCLLLNQTELNINPNIKDIGIANIKGEIHQMLLGETVFTITKATVAKSHTSKILIHIIILQLRFFRLSRKFFFLIRSSCSWCSGCNK